MVVVAFSDRRVRPEEEKAMVVSLAEEKEKRGGDLGFIRRRRKSERGCGGGEEEGLAALRRCHCLRRREGVVLLLPSMAVRGEICSWVGGAREIGEGRKEQRVSTTAVRSCSGEREKKWWRRRFSASASPEKMGRRESEGEGCRCGGSS
ncbi:hypothetical protein HAX54_001801, partial [Datura stramonium]|nr:hypothetical protein [Datura stramonium]